MRNFLLHHKGYILVLCLLIAGVSARTASAQVLSAGEIVFTGYLSSDVGVDTFSFVLLKNVPAGTVINFTDNAWLNPGVFRAGEQTATLTLTIALVAGREIKITGPSAGAATATSYNSTTNTTDTVGTVTGSMLSFSTTGDQVFAYQGTAATPTFIAGLHANGLTVAGSGDCADTTNAAWDPDCFDGAGGTVGNTNWSKKPASLTAGFSAVYLGTEGVNNSDPDNGVFNCTGPLNTPAQIRTAVNNSANWIKTNGTPSGLHLPSTCVYLFSPSAAGVDISGRVISSDGRAVRGALVTLTSADGTVRTSVSSAFGYYRFTDVVVGETYIIGATSKRYTFTPQTVLVSDEIVGLEMIGQ